MTNHSPVENLPVVTYNTLPVITTDMLAQVYGTETIRIQQNHKRNGDRFIAGKHFFKLEGDELKTFKNRLSLSESVGKRARSLILWTERGAARHAKMLETDQAWEVFEKLEDCYFNQRQSAEPPALPRRWLMSVDSDGTQKATPIPDDAYVMNAQEFLSALAQDARVDRKLLADFIIVATQRLHQGYEYFRRKSQSMM
ncbi:ORF6N domain-containing protein [Entomohabitans teleogrylli]|uniref:ORF6N domain-containing protein n=1 Tax=Entomohabitans teleogrylli TaxID=1384589 RepID=UPI0009EA8E86|nr:ORF6N domain-containing protein [Entomohabitans teleogrylli]